MSTSLDDLANLVIAASEARREVCDDYDRLSFRLAYELEKAGIKKSQAFEHGDYIITTEPLPIASCKSCGSKLLAAIPPGLPVGWEPRRIKITRKPKVKEPSCRTSVASLGTTRFQAT